MSKVPEDYVDVAQRIREFKELYPDGSLQRVGEPWIMRFGERDFVCYCAAAYRTPDDQRPGIGTAWEPVPGPTPFTRDSELMNAETAAWGRAIVAVGFETKKIASADEVRNRQAESEFKAPPAAAEKTVTKGTLGVLKQTVETLQKGFPKPDTEHKYWDDVQAYVYAEFGKTESGELTEAEAQQVVLEFEKRLITEQNVANAPFTDAGVP